MVHPDQVLAGGLEGYAHLVVPTNSLHDLGENADLEAAVHAWVAAGGTVFHGPDCGLSTGAQAGT